MSTKYHKIRVATKICQRICKKFFTKLNKQVIWLLRIIFRSSRTQETGNAGFVLPVVVLVSLVVVLLTTAILFRAFDRSRNASNVRVDEALVNAAMPAVDRAKAKLSQLLSDPGLPRSTPSDTALYGIIKNTTTNTINTAYTFGDEIPLELAVDINNNGTLENGISNGVYTIENDESLNTAWEFPVDTDNNGKFDTFTIYAIYFRSPPRDTSTGKFTRVRNGLEARTPPMNENEVGGACATANGTSAGLVGNSSWYQQAGGNLAKSFYVYTANVPINSLTGLSATNYETKANRGFSSLEYEQDRFLAPVNNQAVWFENDLELTPGSNFYLNGAIHTNSNLLAGGQFSNVTVAFRQVSSVYSCYYSQQNGLITVGGNFGTNNVASPSAALTNVNIDLYQGVQQTPNTSATIGSTGTSGSGVPSTQSTTSSGGSSVGYNDAALSNRINLMTTTAYNLCTACTSASTVAQLTTSVEAMGTATPAYPSALINAYTAAINTANYSSGDVTDALSLLQTQIQLYFSNRTRRVPYAEVKLPDTNTKSLYAGASSTTAYTSTTIFPTSPIDVPFAWRDISTTNTGLTLNDGQFPATNPTQQTIDGKQNYTGDRVFTGNNLPAYWQSNNSPPGSGSTTTAPYVTGSNETQQVDTSTLWDKHYSGNPNAIRTRTTQVVAQLDLGVTDRGDFWEISAAESPTNLANVGGMRIVTGAGIYVDDDGNNGTGIFPRNYQNNPAYTFLPPPTLDPLVGNSSSSLGLVCSSTSTNCPVTTSNTNTGQMPYPAPISSTQPNILVWPDTMPMTSPSSIQIGLSGDLLMRATAVYHYASSYGVTQTPIACVSSYYDPTNPTTAQNLSTLTQYWKNPYANTSTTSGKSNNGIVYSFPGRTLTSATAAALTRQARLIFPNGTVANLPLRTAMQKYNATTNGGFAQFSYADYSAIDTALCSLGILSSYAPYSNNTALTALGITSTVTATSTTGMSHGFIKESSFLDAREVKAVQNLGDYKSNSSTLLGDYGLPLEQRQPLEIRSTDIDLTSLAKTKLSSTSSEYLLPLSGIIYATRDDAIVDNSYASITTSNTANTSSTGTNSSIVTSSQTDFKLDPTRRPNAIRLINTNGLTATGTNPGTKGVILARGGANSSTYNSAEKGLVLATNIPVYVKGTFNLHTVDGTTQIQEFTNPTAITSTNWYNNGSGSSTTNTDFACRPGRPGCTSTQGDLWRPATILSDAVTILSDSFTDGFRADGDFDLNRNYLSIPPVNLSIDPINNLDLINYPNGLVNNFVTNANWASTTSPYPPANKASSYLANGVTPIQRRATFNEYLMESCYDIVVNCDNNKPSKWTVDGTNPASSLLGISPAFGVPASGTTVIAPTNPGYVRRVAFQRYTTTAFGHNSGDLFLVGGLPVPIGVTRVSLSPLITITVSAAPYLVSSVLPSVQPGALWFKTTTSTSDPTASVSYAAGPGQYLALLPWKTTTNTTTPPWQQNPQSQPQLAPVTQIFDPDGLPGGTSLQQGTPGETPGIQQNWVQQASTTSANTFNIGFAAGNSPSRPTEYSAGLQNFVRFLENWYMGSGAQSAGTTTSNISGSFIQFKRSSYATAPYAQIITATSTTAPSSTTPSMSLFVTPFNNSSNKNNYYTNQGTTGTTPYYVPPNRNWGFDVALLSQLPDLFAQQFTVPPSSPPTEYFREVNSDDTWLQALLCAKQYGTGNNAVPAQYRPTTCPTATYP